MNMQTNNVITKNCKVAFQGEMKRFTLDRADFCILRKQLCALYPQLKTKKSAAIFYAKHGNLIRISSDEELHMALKASDNVLHLRVALPRTRPIGPERARARHPRFNLTPPPLRRGGMLSRRGPHVIRRGPHVIRRGPHVVHRGPSHPLMMRRLQGIGKFHNKRSIPTRRILSPNASQWRMKFVKFENRCVSRPDLLQHRIIQLFQRKKAIMTRLAQLGSHSRRIPHVVRLQHREKLRRHLSYVCYCLDRLIARQAATKSQRKLQGIPPKIANARLPHHAPMRRDTPIPKNQQSPISEQNRPRNPSDISRECAEISGKISESLAGLQQVRQKLQHLRSERARDTTKEKMQVKEEIRSRIAHLDHLHRVLRGKREFLKNKESARDKQENSTSKHAVPMQMRKRMVSHK